MNIENSKYLKNELIFQFASGNTNLAKSLMASTYLFLNSHEIKNYNMFENYCGNELKNTNEIQPSGLSSDDCIVENSEISNSSNKKGQNPLNKIINNYDNLKWKRIFSGFYEHVFTLSKKESAKLIKMDAGAKVPLHSHSGKEYILVLEGSISDENGKYTKGSLQINDSQIKHTPIACKNEGCICLTITEKDIIFYGPFSPFLNIITLFKSLFFSK